MPENAGVDPEGSHAARAPRGLVLVAVLALAVGLAVAANTLGESFTQPPPRPPPADATTTVSEPTPSDSLTTPSIRVETALPAIGGLALGGQRGSYLTRNDPTAVIGPWTVVVRRVDGSLGRYGAVVTYPAPTNDAPNTGAPIRIGSASGISGPGFILWPLGNGQARIRGDLPQADLVHIAELSTVVAGQPQVRPPAGFRVIARAPSRLLLVHEIRYASADLREISRMGVAALGALSTSELLQEPDQNLVDAVIDSLIEGPVEEIEEAVGEVEVIEIDNTDDN